MLNPFGVSKVQYFSPFISSKKLETNFRNKSQVANVLESQSHVEHPREEMGQTVSTTSTSLTSHRAYSRVERKGNFPKEQVIT